VKTGISKHLPLAAWSGMIGSALFVGVFLLEGWIRPGYNPLTEYVSALSLGARGWVQIANFVLFGALLFGFTRAVAAEFPNGKASRWGLILLTIIASGYFFSGPFVMDPASTPQAEATFHGTLHGILGAIVFLLMPITMFVFWRRFHSDPKWQFLQGWTLILGIICAAVDIYFSIISKVPILLTSQSPWIGLIQRGVIVPFMIWVFVFALGITKVIHEPGSLPGKS
jgi:Protein of unknown function (DUF998)